ncbi:hypothetical protein D3C83_03600 [compost metagenome]
MQAVGLGAVVELVRARDGAAARHVADDDRRVAGQILLEKRRECAAVDVAAAARVEGHEHFDALAGEIDFLRRRIGERETGEGGKRAEPRRDPERAEPVHVSSSFSYMGLATARPQPL